MSSKFQPKPLQQQNLRKIFQDIHQQFSYGQSSPSLQKKLSPFKKMLISAKDSQSPFKFIEYIIQNKGSGKKLQANKEGCGKQNSEYSAENQEFLELYNNDPIFKCRIQRLFNEEQKKLRKGSLKVPTRQSLEVNSLEEDGFELRTTLKNHTSESDRMLLTKIQSYKKLLKRQNSNETSPSSEDNQ